MTHRIGLDLKTFSNSAAGIGRYTVNLINHLIQREKHKYIGFCSPQTDFSLAERPTSISSGIHQSLQSTVLRSYLLPIKARSEKLSVFHSMDNSLVHSWGNTRCKRISTIHDLIVLKFPEYFTRKHVTVVRGLLNYAIRNADHIITVSHATKSDLLEYYPKLDESKISVTHLAASDHFKPIDQSIVEEFLQLKELPREYFFSLGTIEPRKNHQMLVEAFVDLKKKADYRDIGLLIAGGQGWLNSDSILNDDTKCKELNITKLGFVSEETLPILFSGALAFVYPSLYEGFGLPVLEAMKCGCPVIVSNTSSLPEVVGDSALLVDPQSKESIISAMNKVNEDLNLRKQLKKRSIQQSNLFSWDNTAFGTEQVYQTLV